MHIKSERTHNGGMFAFFPLSPSPSPAVIDMLFHPAQHKPRRHGYSCRDVLSPGDGQYLNNGSPHNTIDRTHNPALSPRILSCCSSPCSGKNPPGAGSRTNGLAGGCAVPAPTPLPLPRAPRSGVCIAKTHKTWRRGLWVKDLGQWQLIGPESATVARRPPGRTKSDGLASLLQASF